VKVLRGMISWTRCVTGRGSRGAAAPRATSELLRLTRQMPRKYYRSVNHRDGGAIGERGTARHGKGKGSQ
jgi:hypothetical protein